MAFDHFAGPFRSSRSQTFRASPASPGGVVAIDDSQIRWWRTCVGIAIPGQKIPARRLGVTNGASQPFLFHVIKCEASELLITSTRAGAEEIPDRPLKQALRPGTLDLYGQSRDTAPRKICPASRYRRSMDEYRITFASLRAASTSADVIGHRFRRCRLQGCGERATRAAAEP